ncbi:unnamed protein product [Durusdinium trenchii]|uniref:GPI inositol-deacylase n=1 Tax=Durusdinium trenchii TaxID=1381693 RepID=A0ABP0J6D8_9DINO
MANLDNAWLVGVERARIGGKCLAHVLADRQTVGQRPVTLIGHSMGARLLVYCLCELYDMGELHVVDDVVLLGTPVTTEPAKWQKDFDSFSFDVALNYLDLGLNIGYNISGLLGLRHLAEHRVAAMGVYGGEAHHFQLKHPNYAFIGARHQLRRVHLALYKKYKFLDYDKDLIIFSSNLLAMMESEMKTFTLLIRMLEKFYWKRLLRPEIDDETHGKQRSQEQVLFKVKVTLFEIFGGFACDRQASSAGPQLLVAEMNCSDMLAFLPLGVAGGWWMLGLDSVLPGSGLVIPAACACMGLAAVYKEGLGTLVSKFCKPSKDVIMGPFFVEEPEEEDDEDEADESLEVNLDEEVTFEFLWGYGQWQTGLRLTYHTEAGLATLPSRSADAAAWVIHEQTRRTAWSAAVGSLWEMLWNRLVPNVITCNSVIASTTKFAGAWIVGLYILESLRGRLELNPSSFNGLLPSLTWWSTLQLCNLMASCHVSADVISFSSSMRALDEVDLWPHALQRLDEMEMPNVVSYSSCGQGRWPLALELMQLSRTSRCFPTERSLGHCINACRKGGQWQIPLQMLTELDQHRQGNVICFSSAIDAVTFSGRWDVALELLAHMEDQKVFANDITYNAVLNACASVGQLDMALKLLEVMEELRCANVVSYSSCIATCEKGGHWQMALHLLSRGEGRRWPANAVSYSSAMSTCSKCSYWQVAISLLASMMGQALAPNTINFNCALSACETGANLPLALKILDTMRARAVPYDVISINSLLNACSTTNDWRCSLDLLIGGGPTDSRVSPNHISLLALIGDKRASITFDGVSDTWALGRQMGGSCSRPTVLNPFVLPRHDPFGTAIGLPRNGQGRCQRGQWGGIWSVWAFTPFCYFRVTLKYMRSKIHSNVQFSTVDTGAWTMFMMFADVAGKDKNPFAMG